jgi:hypothetical protein
MKYAFTIYVDENQRTSAGEEEQKAMSQAYAALTQEMQEKNVLVAGEGLYPTPTATTVRVREGDREVTDGPFAETKEALGGFYLIEAATKEEAVEWGKKIPLMEGGFIDVVPVWQM